MLNNSIIHYNALQIDNFTSNPLDKRNNTHLTNCIGGVMVRVLASSAVDRGFKSRLGLETIRLVFVASPLSTKH